MSISTKWPRLLVAGDSITTDQAAEIIARTSRWSMLFSNDKQWLRQINACLAEIGAPVEPHWDRPSEERMAYWRQIDEWEAAHGVLRLSYLDSTSRIASAWIYGSHGWVDWNGAIGTGGYNIGKWPSDDEVTADWDSVASAFPYLRLTAQLVDDEGEGQLCGQWMIADGAVTHDPDPTELIIPVPPFGTGGSGFMPALRYHGERGCTVDQLRRALSLLRAGGQV